MKRYIVLTFSLLFLGLFVYRSNTKDDLKDMLIEDSNKWLTKSVDERDILKKSIYINYSIAHMYMLDALGYQISDNNILNYQKEIFNDVFVKKVRYLPFFMVDELTNN